MSPADQLRALLLDVAHSHSPAAYDHLYAFLDEQIGIADDLMKALGGAPSPERTGYTAIDQAFAAFDPVELGEYASSALCAATYSRRARLPNRATFLERLRQHLLETRTKEKADAWIAGLDGQCP